MVKVELENSAFIRAFTYSILKTLKNQSREKLMRPSFEKERSGKKYVVNSDLIPNVHENIVRPRMLGEKKINFREGMSESIIHQANVRQPQAVRNVRRPQTMNAPKDVFVPGVYGKIQKLIDDPSVATIECPGGAKNVFVTRVAPGFGYPIPEKQVTKLILTKGEIHNFLEIVSEKVRIPLQEGTFRAAVSGFIVDAVISEMIGTRFLIKKRQSNVPQVAF